MVGLRPLIGRSAGRRLRIVAIVENVPLARDHRLRKQVASLQTLGFDVTVITPADPGNSLVSNVRVLEYRSAPEFKTRWSFVLEYGYAWLASAWLVARARMRGPIDVFQVSGSPDIFFTVTAPFRRLGAKTVFDQRDLWPETYATRYSPRSGLIYRALVSLERMSYRSADAVLVVNESLRQIALRRGGVSPADVTIIGNGPVLARIERLEQEVELVRTADRAPGRHLCIWAGLMGPQDRVELALRAISVIIHSLARHDCDFIFIGDGESRPEMERLAQTLQVTEWVKFTGWLEEADVFRFIAAADIGLDSNLQDFVSPVKIMEYMAFGLPVVAFDLLETKTLAGDAASYAAPSDVEDFARRVVALLDDPPRRATMAECGRRRVQESISWEHQETKYAEVFRRLLERDNVGTEEAAPSEISLVETRAVPSVSPGSRTDTQ